MGLPGGSTVRILASALAALLVSGIAPAAAGSVCGRVTDAETGRPVAGAGVFVRTVEGAYTGWVGASDDTGAYCVVDVAPGTYDLEIRHDDYALRYVRGVIVDDPVTGADAALAYTGLTLEPPRPNPARRSLSFSFRAETDARVVVHDVRGRFVHGWSAAGGASLRHVDWDLRDRSGNPLASGTYWLRLETGASVVARRFVVLH